MRASELCAILLLVVPNLVAQSNTPAWKNGAQERKCGLGTYQDSLAVQSSPLPAATIPSRQDGVSQRVT